MKDLESMSKKVPFISKLKPLDARCLLHGPPLASRLFVMSQISFLKVRFKVSECQKCQTLHNLYFLEMGVRKKTGKGRLLLQYHEKNNTRRAIKPAHFYLKHVEMIQPHLFKENKAACRCAFVI